MLEEGITVTVRDKNAVEWIRNKLQNGAFTSATDAVEHGIAALREEDSNVEDWLQNVVADRHRRHQEHPEIATPLELLVASLEAHRKQLTQDAM